MLTDIVPAILSHSLGQTSWDAMKTVRSGAVVGVLALVLSRQAMGATVQTFGSGTAVATADLSTSFDSLTANNVVHLDTYAENGLSVTTSSDSWASDLNLSAKLDPFHGASGPDRAFYAIAWANEDWVTIQPTNGALMHGVEFMYGNGWTTGDIFGQYPWGNDRGWVDWQTFKDGAAVSAGQIGPTPVLALGTILGFYDPVGFHQLLVRCRIDNSSSPNLQEIALENLHVMLTNVPPAPTIYGGDFSVDPATKISSLTVFDTIPGCEYRLVYADSLTTPTWNAVGSLPPNEWKGGGAVLTFSDPGALGATHRFYRVQVR